MISKELKNKIDAWVQKYPKDQKRAALMGALMEAQKSNEGYLTEPLIHAVANYLEVAPVAALEVASFYSMYERAPVGKYRIAICHNVSCMLNGSDELLAHMEQRLGIRAGEADAKCNFSLKKVECLGACKDAPVIAINDEFCEKVSPESFDHWYQNAQAALVQQDNAKNRSSK